MISVADLCEITGSSQRTLEYAFKQQFHFTPKRYIIARQLNFVMRDLRKSSHKKATVTEIANHWGFSHAGQFAKDYFSLFGELPNKTLRKNPVADELSASKIIPIGFNKK